MGQFDFIFDASDKLEIKAGASLLNKQKNQMESFKENHPNGFNMAEALNYEHPPFDEQLDAGIRSLEIKTPSQD
jgi:hypothetical protein